MTTRLQAPAGVTAVSFAGQQFDVAADGTITFDGPEEARAVAHFRTAGFTDPTTAKPKKGSVAAQAQAAAALETAIEGVVEASQQ